MSASAGIVEPEAIAVQTGARSGRIGRLIEAELGRRARRGGSAASAAVPPAVGLILRVLDRSTASPMGRGRAAAVPDALVRLGARP